MKIIQNSRNHKMHQNSVNAVVPNCHKTHGHSSLAVPQKVTKKKTSYPVVKFQQREVTCRERIPLFKATYVILPLFNYL